MEQTVITLSKNTQGWQAVFANSNNGMPNGVALPLPYTWEATADMIKVQLRRNFPNALFVVKANSRDQAS